MLHGLAAAAPDRMVCMVGKSNGQVLQKIKLLERFDVLFPESFCSLYCKGHCDPGGDSQRISSVHSPHFDFSRSLRWKIGREMLENLGWDHPNFTCRRVERQVGSAHSEIPGGNRVREVPVYYRAKTVYIRVLDFLGLFSTWTFKGSDHRTHNCTGRNFIIFQSHVTRQAVDRYLS